MKHLAKPHRCSYRTMLRVTLALLIIVVGLFICYHFAVRQSNTAFAEATASATLQSLRDNDFVPLRTAMELNGYVAESERTFTKSIGGITVEIAFDSDFTTCRKNLYTFDTAGSVITWGDDAHIKRGTLERILNCAFSYDENGALHARAVTYYTHGWTRAFVPLVAHAGGALRKSDSVNTYTNSLEALVQNYDLGHRLFEFDFSLTTDGKLAALHHWGAIPGNGETPMTAAQWRELGRISGTDCTTILLDDILEQMMINTDMFLITDSKLTEGEDMRAQLRILRDEALARDPALIARIVPQIYNVAMYDEIMAIYPFESIIFTLYQTDETHDEILEFVAAHDDVAAVVMFGFDEQLPLIQPLNALGKVVYLHTYNDFADIARARRLGAHGLYTDELTPRDFEFYASLS